MDDYTFAVGVGAASWAGAKWMAGWARSREERLQALEAKADSLGAECQQLRDQVGQFQRHEATLLEKISHLEKSLASCQFQLEETTRKLREAMDRISRHQSRSLARRAIEYLWG